MTTSLGEDELLTEIRFQVPQGKVGSAYEKLANKASHYSVVGAAVDHHRRRRRHRAGVPR